MDRFVRVCGLEELRDGEARVIELEGRKIALFRLEDEVYALDNDCPHRGGPIAEGEIQGGRVTCPWHEWTFDIRSGLCTLNSAVRLTRFDARVVDGEVRVCSRAE
jgi:nitrite reductase (NADH) small subunit